LLGYDDTYVARVDALFVFLTIAAVITDNTPVYFINFPLAAQVGSLWQVML
jgi:hypothetical protein